MSANIHNNTKHTINYSTKGVSKGQSISDLENKFVIPINQALTDSLSLKLPLLECDVLDERLTSLTATYYESLDSVDCELSPPKPVVVVHNGITVRFSLCEIPIWDNEKEQKIPTKFINLTVSAKLLKERYFEGITLNNISVLYQTFLDFKVFHCPYHVFMKGMVSDIDVCINRYCDRPSTFSSVLQCLYAQTGDRSKHLKIFGESNNIGLNFNQRRLAKPSLPYLKFYHKELELLSKSVDFFNAYLIPFSSAISGLTRVEATIKNYDHKRRLDKFLVIPMFRTLEDYLDIPQKKLFDFVCFSLNSYIVQNQRLKAPNLSPTEHIIYELLQNCILKGYDYKALLCVVDSFKGTSQATTDVSRSRMRKKITELYDLLMHGKTNEILKKENHNTKVNDYLRMFNLNPIL